MTDTSPDKIYLTPVECVVVEERTDGDSVLVDNNRALWGFAVLLYGVGDSVTTVAGLKAADTAEIGPVALTVLDIAGIPGFVLLKVVFLCLCYAVWTRLPMPERAAIPLGLTVTGLGVTSWNLTMLLL